MFRKCNKSYWLKCCYLESAIKTTCRRSAAILEVEHCSEKFGMYNVWKSYFSKTFTEPPGSGSKIVPDGP